MRMSGFLHHFEICLNLIAALRPELTFLFPLQRLFQVPLIFPGLLFGFPLGSLSTHQTAFIRIRCQCFKSLRLRALATYFYEFRT